MHYKELLKRGVSVPDVSFLEHVLRANAVCEAALEQAMRDACSSGTSVTAVAVQRFPQLDSLAVQVYAAAYAVDDQEARRLAGLSVVS